jgi:hypothetical protein
VLAGPLLTTAGAAAVVIGSFLPWLRSGHRGRSSYEMYRLARHLGFADGFLARAGVALWPAVPLLAVGAVVAIWSRARPLGAALALACGAYVTAICVVAWRAPLVALAGVSVCAAGAWILFAGALVALARRR